MCTVLFEIKIIKDYMGTPLGSSVRKLVVAGQCLLKAGRFLVRFLYFLLLFHAKTKHFFLFTYCRKCILFEIKMIKDDTGTPLGSRGFGWGESIYKHKHFLNWGGFAPQALLLGGGEDPPIFLRSHF